jgi:glyoxylase-like metal-dependent hydrolase (beta-lactamase superfamily II)
MRVRLISAHNPGPWTGAGSNTWLIEGAVPTLVDTGSGERQHLDELASALADVPGTELAQVVVTHAHIDHAGGAVAIAERWPGVAFRKFPWPDRDNRYPVPWYPLADDDIVAAGNGDLWAVHTPGHSPDHLCFYEPRSATLFAGDLVVNGGTVVIPASHGGSLAQYLASLRRVLELQPRRILAGHGPPVDVPGALIRGYIAHRLQREQQLLDALGRGTSTVDALVASIYPDVHPDLAAAAAENVRAHLEKLRDEGRALPEPATDAGSCAWRLVG